jgi:hypothetical protein
MESEYLQSMDVRWDDEPTVRSPGFNQSERPPKGGTTNERRFMESLHEIDSSIANHELGARKARPRGRAFRAPITEFMGSFMIREREKRACCSPGLRLKALQIPET